MVVVAGLVAEVAVVAVVSKPPSLLVPIAVVDSSNQSTKDQLGEETLKVQKKGSYCRQILIPSRWQTKRNTTSTIVLSRKTLSRTKLGC